MFGLLWWIKLSVATELIRLSARFSSFFRFSLARITFSSSSTLMTVCLQSRTNFFGFICSSSPLFRRPTSFSCSFFLSLISKLMSLKFLPSYSRSDFKSSDLSKLIVSRNYESFTVTPLRFEIGVNFCFVVMADMIGYSILGFPKSFFTANFCFWIVVGFRYIFFFSASLPSTVSSSPEWM